MTVAAAKDNQKLREAVEAAGGVLAQAEQRARDLIVFADGVEEAGFRMYAQRARAVADDLLRVAGDLRAERSVRVAIQTERDRLRAMISAGKLRLPREWTSA
jgi:isopentenyl diphosphate isomerase/L-lactate dehydrogenase-like FMN-dependent dehydrogenase